MLRICSGILLPAEISGHGQTFVQKIQRIARRRLLDCARSPKTASATATAF